MENEEKVEVKTETACGEFAQLEPEKKRARVVTRGMLKQRVENLGFTLSEGLSVVFQPGGKAFIVGLSPSLPKRDLNLWLDGFAEGYFYLQSRIEQRAMEIAEKLLVQMAKPMPAAPANPYPDVMDL